jgi:DNA-directed RNA polymerase
LATPSEIERQVNFERDAIKQGAEKLAKQTRDLEEKSYASASVYGTASIHAALPEIIKLMQQRRNDIFAGKNGFLFAEITAYLDDIDTATAACIGCKVTFDKVFSRTPDTDLVANVGDAIGTAIEHEAAMCFYERECPGLLKSIKDNYWHNTTGTQQKYTIIRTLMNRYDDVPKWKSWDRTLRIKLGGWVLRCIIEATGWFTHEWHYKGKKKIQRVLPTPEFAERKDELLAQAELFSPIAYPMLIEPNDWSNERQGGYLLNEVMRGHDMVRRGVSCIQGETPIAFLNKIQKVALTLNPFTIMVAEQLMERGVSVGKFIPVVEIPKPPKPVDIATNKDSRKDYRRKVAEVMNKNAGSFKKSCRTRMTMQAVEYFKNEDKFFLPWSLDYRGRAYPIPAFLTPQDTDFGKSLIMFYNQSLMTPSAESWLAFQVATTYGLDKAPMNERLEWVNNNHKLIERIALDPIGCLPDWEAAEEPWQFLAACDEYYHCVIYCDRNYTRLPVATDATCSGLQILAGLCRDAGTASLVNVLPGSRPSDAYRTVADHARPSCPEAIREHLDRKVVKRVVMTVPYNAKPHSNRGYIRDALKEKGIEISKEDLTDTVNAVRDTMHVIVPGPMRAMEYIEAEVAKAIKRGETTIQWVTPSGFVVTQRLMKKEYERIVLQLLGRVNLRVAVGDSDVVDINHHKNATAPNLIHSLDASLLHLSVLRFDAPIALIHDSVLCRATDMTSLSSVVRDVYMHLFAEHDYFQSWADQIGAETEPPMINTLDPESVIESTYFFC